MNKLEEIAVILDRAKRHGEKHVPVTVYETELLLKAANGALEVYRLLDNNAIEDHEAQTKLGDAVEKLLW